MQSRSGKADMIQEEIQTTLDKIRQRYNLNSVAVSPDQNSQKNEIQRSPVRSKSITHTNLTASTQTPRDKSAQIYTQTQNSLHSDSGTQTFNLKTSVSTSTISQKACSVASNTDKFTQELLIRKSVQNQTDPEVISTIEIQVRAKTVFAFTQTNVYVPRILNTDIESFSDLLPDANVHDEILGSLYSLLKLKLKEMNAVDGEIEKLKVVFESG